MIQNSHGKIWYGMHFYPGLAQYQDSEEAEPYRVYLNEDTLRKMDPTFAARPIFVEHVDEVDPNLDRLRSEADGWVIESFYNSSDGKHWVKFITVSDEAEKAIRNGFRLSNAYVPKNFGPSGIWNGISYQKEITDGEYEHLAIVKNPRYEESVIMTPEEFKKYNEDNLSNLKKIANSKKGGKMLSFFKKSKVEIDNNMCVVLPKSKKEVSITKLINDADEMEKKKDSSESAKAHVMASGDHMVKMKDGSYMQVSDLADKFHSMKDEMDKVKKDSKEKELDLKTEETPVDAEGDLHNLDEAHPEEAVHDEDEAMMDDEDKHEAEVHAVEHKEELKDAEDPEEDKEAKKKALQLAEHEEKEIEEAKMSSKKNIKKNDYESKALAKMKAERLKNAHLRVFQNEESRVVELSYDRVLRGKQRYGS